MSRILNFDKWLSINESKISSDNSFKEWKKVFESTSGDIDALVAQARENDSDAVKSTPGYDEVMNWFDNEGPAKGKAIIDEESILKSLRYWNGDLSDKTSDKSKRAIEACELLSNEDTVNKLMKKLQSASGTSKYLSYDIKLITDAASKLKVKFEELNKAGKEVGQQMSDKDKRRYDVQTALNTEKYPFRLGILPWAISTSEGLDEYKGKDILSGNAKQFTKWYDTLKKDGVDSLIKYLNDNKYVRSKAVGIEDDDKINILKKYVATAAKRKKNIEDALAIKLYPASAKNTVTSGSETDVTENPTEYAEFKFPMNTDIAKTFFGDDEVKIDGKFSNSISEFVSGIKAQLPEGAKVTEVTVKAVASTSTVPSTKYFNSGGNEKLVSLRLAAIEKDAFTALQANDLAGNVKYDKSGSLPNNGPAYDKNKYGKDKRNANPAVREEYEKIFGEFRYSGLQILIAYQIESSTPTVTPTLDIKVTGEWKSYITWSEPSKQKNTTKWKPGKLTFRRSNGGLYPTKSGTGCTNFCKAYE